MHDITKQRKEEMRARHEGRSFRVCRSPAKPKDFKPFESVKSRVGTYLKLEIKWLLKVRPTSSCRCAEYAAELNNHSNAWCRKHVGSIIGRLMEHRDLLAESLGVPSGVLNSVFAYPLLWAGAQQFVWNAIRKDSANSHKRRVRTPSGRRKRPARPVEKPVLPVVFRRHTRYQWAVGMTVAVRKTPSWKRAIVGAQQAGWKMPMIFAEPNTDVPVNACTVKRPMTIAPPMFTDFGKDGLYGAHQNYMQALADLLQLHPSATHLLYIQDDCFLSRGSREFLESIHWPDDAALLSLWCPSGHSYQHQEAGLRRVPNQNIIGAVAYAMRRETAEWLLQSADMLNWKGSRKNQTGHHRRTLDMATGRALQNAGKVPYYFTRSIADHFEPTKGNSSIGNGAVKGFRKSFQYVGDNVPFSGIKRAFRSAPVHVVIPAHECLPLTLSCLDALLMSTVDIHVCYVDNGSSQNTVDSVRKRLAGHNYEIIQNETNVGFTAAVQSGISHAAHNRHILILNNDCRVQPNTIEELLVCMAESPDRAAICPVTNDNGVCSLERDVANQVIQQSRASRIIPMLPWFCCLLNRAAVDQVGSLPVDSQVASGLGVDDWWCKKVRKNGWHLRVTGKAYAEHDHSATFKATGQDRKQLQSVARRWLKSNSGV